MQNLLDLAERVGGPINAQNAQIANKLVGLTWERNPDRFGPHRPLPDKFVLAACAISAGINAADKMGDQHLRRLLIFALTELCKEILMRQSQGGQGMTSYDAELFGDVAEHLQHINSSTS